MANSYRQTFNPLTGNFDLVLSGTAVLEPNLIYDQVVYVDKSNSRTYIEDGSYDKPFKSLVSMFSNVTDASAAKKYACMIAPGSYVEANTLALKPYINLISFANDTVLISKLNGTSVKWSNNTPGRLFIQGISFTNGVEVLNDNPTGVNGMVLDLDNCELASLIFNGRGGGIDFIQLRNDSRVSGITTIKSASTTIFNSTLIGLLTLNDVGCLNPDSFGSAITATLRNNYQLNVSIATTSFDVYVDAWGNNNIGTLTIVSNSSVASTFNCDVSTYPGTISLSGSPLPVVIRTSKTQGISYTPSTPANWPVVPDDAKEALDDLASRISSSNISVEKDNTAIVNPASVLNFEGTPFVVTAAGGGQANIKIGPRINFDPVNLATITSPIDGDLACDINAQFAIKRYNAATSSWVSNISNLVFGDVDGGLNLGAGTGIFAQKLAGNLEFKSLTEGAHIDFTSTSTEINAKVKNIATPQLNWIKDTNGPITEFIDGFLFESFDNISAQEIYAILNVPNTHIAGSQITLKNGEFFCVGTSPGTVQFQSVATLINSSTVLGTYTNTYTSTNAAVTLSATSNLITSIGNIDLTNASGQINAVAVQPGDKIRIKLYRIASGSTSDARLIMDSLEPYFE